MFRLSTYPRVKTDKESLQQIVHHNIWCSILIKNFEITPFEQKGSEPLEILGKLNEIAICGRFWVYPPPHSSSKGGSLICASNLKFSFLLFSSPSLQKKKSCKIGPGLRNSIEILYLHPEAGSER